jgi:hypothetical protein
MEPKSIHTYLDSEFDEIYAYDVDVCIKEFPFSADPFWLYYFALQVNFTSYDEWSHGGFQWAHIVEFRDSANKGVNWGGGSNWAGYGGLGINNTPFSWECNKWYRYRVWRVDDDSEGYHRWLLAILDYETNKENQYGTIRTKSFYIKSSIVFTETGYGVQCDSPRVSVEWRNPTFLTPAGKYVPQKIVANYNGTCIDPTNTNQGLIPSTSLQWFHETNTCRTIKPDTILWHR